ncbi:MAG TPA: amidohydrolase family protein [Prolixibacteraceae bacterium]|nr:amidohydrolase family protein [Prolixibacteraceae bacterium]HOS00764.1 amidohydrolase family protein [Prolixibacteraceae bacterium]HOS90400.1 amidohydrolase family protein [Prolixibacteraceae bacterium]HPL44917.1 amidohydrolase family protein [Prolixibacteraceae bacterium]HQJ85636.1 amidohydrolase family protein [Prolixibacteraceae bacterium]
MRRKFIFMAIALSIFSMSYAQEKKVTRLPVFDIHVHAMKMNSTWSSSMCPWFLTSMPEGDPNEAPDMFMNLGCVDPLQPAKSDEDMQNEVIRRISDFNMTMVAFGDPGILYKWVDAAPPGRIIPGIGISNAAEMTVEAFRDSLRSGFYKAMPEVAPQYQGLSPDDPTLEPYFAVAEELNIPVGLHMGTGGNGMANITQPKYRASLGDPFLLEDLLARHPKMKVWVMHAGYPILEHMIAIMGANAYIYVDISGMIWSYPLDDVHYYIKRMIQAGFGKRIMYGTDFVMWPRLFETSMGVIEHAQYLSEDQKRDILFNNAVRFLRLDKDQFEWPE